jgi:HD-like signal output (HDOD) protein
MLDFNMSIDRSTIITLGSALPPAVGIFGRLEALLRRGDSSLDDIVELVRVDSALTFQIIRLGNSVFYGLKNHCESLEEAVARIGFRDIHSLVGLVAARQACQQDLRAYQILARHFWENSVATGLLMAAFAESNGTDARNAYSTGLLRNLGRVVINNYSGAVRYPGAAVAPDLNAWEKSTYDISEAEVGAILLEHWRFSADPIGAVRAHYDLGAAAEPVLPAAMLHLSAGVADSWGLGLPGENRWQNDPAVLLRAGLADGSEVKAIAAARQNFDRVAGIQWANAA